MRLNFKAKALIQSFVSLFSNREGINYWFQRNITKSLPMSMDGYREKWEKAKLHIDSYAKFSKGRKKAIAYEFGAGWDMATSLFLSTHGCERVYCVDLIEHVTHELLNASLNAMLLAGLIDKPVTFHQESFRDTLRDEFAIEYLAPYDARKVDFPDSLFNMIYTTNVLEHIPKDDIPSILKECHRLLADDGVLSMCIDYSDHYHSIDKSISPYNFLRYSDNQWKKYNNPLQYMNRLRHNDFVKLFQDCGFQIIVAEPSIAKGFVGVPKGLPVASQFLKKYSKEDLDITGGYFVLKAV